MSFEEKMDKKIENVLDHPVWFILKCGFILIFICMVLGGINWLGKMACTPAKVAEIVLDPNNIIYNYEWFKQTNEDVKKVSLNIKDAQEELEQFDKDNPVNKRTFQDKDERARLATVLTGLKQHRASLVADYNAKSKMASRNIFKDNNLPERLD